MKPLRIFIGFDAVESVAYHALCQSIIDTSTVPVSFTPVKRTMLHEYTRKRDPKQSNEFSFTRFLTPYLAGYEGPALFMDLDMLLRVDIKELFDLYDPKYAVMVCKHDYVPKNDVKYLGAVQYRYARKNWSSVMLFNAGHEHCQRLTPEYVNKAEPAALHRFWWTHDDYVGDIPVEWNWLVGEYPYNEQAKNVHFTIGGPYFEEYSGCDYSDEWRSAHDNATFCLQMRDIKRKAE